MPLKKSAMLLVLMAVCSVSLLVFSSAITTAGKTIEPLKCTPAKCCREQMDIKTFSPWDMVSQIMLRAA